MTPCMLTKLLGTLESIDHLCINHIRRLGLIHKSSLDSCKPKWSAHVNFLLNNCNQNITQLSLLVGTTVRRPRIVLSKIDENRLNKQWRVYLDFGRAGSLSLQLY